MKDNGGPAFPLPIMEHVEPKPGYQMLHVYQGGMSLRQYAAIKLRVPDSDTDWLDEMIRKSLRNDMEYGGRNEH